MEEQQQQGKLKVFSREVLPIRLIDVRATLGSKNGGIHFVAPRGWNFHVISHTWSKEICDLSEHISNLILGRWWMPDVLWRFFERADVFASWLWRWWMPKWYNQSCKRARLWGKPAYKELMEFLQLLADDQVTHIWFDMLCINQNDDREKSREIPHMGAYYSYSKGCYVSVHGIGQGYRLWSENDCGSLPRWFDRVWTLQEFALPESFLVITELDQTVQKIVTGLIRTKSNSSVGFCRCCILKGVLRDTAHRLWWPSRLELLHSSGLNIELHQDQLGLNEELFPGLTATDDEILCGQSACSVCGMSSLVRRVQGTISGRAIYVVEREAYLFVLYIESLFPLNSSMAASSRIWDLMISLKRPWDTWTLLDEVASRQCTRDEDRVLGILGLLGIGGEMQLRTGQSLEQQLVQVAKICDPDLLMKICVVDLGGGVHPGMSWAPNFRGQASGRERICGLTTGDVEGLFEHHPGGPFQCCGHLKPGRDILQQPLDMAQVSKSMAELDSKINRFSDFKRQVQILDVSNHGVMLEAKVVVGQVMPYEMLRSKDQKAEKATTVATLPATRSEEDPEKSPLWLWRGAGGAIESPIDHTPTHCIHFQDVGIFLPLIVTLYPSTTQPLLAMADAGYPSNAIFMSLPHNQGAYEALLDVNLVGGHRLEDKRLSIEMEMWFVLLGTVGNGGYNVAMACVGRKGNMEDGEIVELHKVGMFVLPSLQIGDALFGSNHGLTKCVVGGFAEDLGKLVNVHLARGLT